MENMRRTTVATAAAKRHGYSYAGEELEKRWPALHKGDHEPFPTEQGIARLAKSHADVKEWLARHDGAGTAARSLQEGWRAFHAGDFAHAIEIGVAQGALGAVLANKAAAILTLYLEKDERKRLAVLRAAIERGERALKELPDAANVHYTLALVLGRYSQRISILEAVAAGYASRVRESLERVLELEPHHAEAHIALGLFHAELVSTLGSIAARLTYRASEDAAFEHFRTALKLAPASPIALVEYAHALKLLDADRHQAQITGLCARAAACKPLDAMEQLDVERARRDCGA
jgi:tetratricopeptide (TPR) repeat protein